MLSFVEFFEIVTGFKPFQWQTELAEAICENKWSEALGLQPATGKTSIIEIWFYCLYRNCHDPVRHIPMRLWYVVDRKVIVDGAAQAADNLFNKITNDPRLVEMSRTIMNRFGCKSPLVVGRIRGGMDRDSKNKWLDSNSPVQPTIITSTIDQYGSRLMFRGYGISPKVRSIHAAMAGMDAFIALDEAHLSQALKRLLELVQTNHKLANIPPNRVMELTATGNNQNVFATNIGNDPALAQRLNAKREITLIRTTKLVDELVKNAKNLSKSNNIVAVIANTVGTARKVFAKLEKHSDTILLTSRIRGHDREKIYEAYLPRLLAKRDRTQDKPLFCVSTQTIEVGADFDFDAMVSQAAPLDCLIQRFGRLDRLGKVGKTTGIVVFKDEKDWVYGTKSKETFELLEKKPKGFDIGTIPRDVQYFADPVYIPTLSPGLVDVLALTHPGTQVNIEGYLHGVTTKPNSDFQLVYRQEITQKILEDNPRQAATWIDSKNLKYRICNQEILAIPIYALQQDDTADNSGIVDDESEIGSGGNFLNQLCLRYRDGKVIRVRDISPGDLIIVPTSFAKYDKFGWNPDSISPVEDVSDYCHSDVIRLHPDWTPGFAISKYQRAELDGLLDTNLLLADLADTLIPRWLATPALAQKASYWKQILPKRVSWYSLTPDKKGVYLHSPKKKRTQDIQELNVHNAKVGHNAKEFARRLNFSDELIALLEMAGRCHDLGKADPRFQEVLYYPKPVESVLLAKSKGYNMNAPHKYPLGWRHELQSLVMVIENKLCDGVIDPELFRHVIAAHHGWYRNFIPPILDEDFKPFALDNLTCSSHCLDVYPNLDRNEFDQLNQKYGYWGLAFLETIIRLADWTN